MDIGNWCKWLLESKEEKKKLAIEALKIPRRSSLYAPDMLAKRPSRGDQLLHILRSTLFHFDASGYQRSYHQRLFHDSMTAACIRHIYKDEFAGNFLKILEENNWSDARQEVMICCPRRFGKTWATAMFVMAYVWAIPNSEVCIFSPSRRQSEKMLELISTMMDKIPGARKHVCKSNRERLWFKIGLTDIRKISSYPSKVTTLKGTSR